MKSQGARTDVFNTPLQTFRVVGWVEGVSFLVLLGIAMPLKYAAGLPEVVLVVGWVHGILWVLYLLTALRVAVADQWTFGTFFWAAVGSVLPFGPFVFDRWLRRKRAESDAPLKSMSGASPPPR